MTSDIQKRQEELDEDQRTAFAMLADYDMDFEDIRELVTESFRPRALELFIPANASNPQ